MESYRVDDAGGRHDAASPNREALFEAALTDALSTPEIIQAMRNVQLGREELVAQLWAQKNDVWTAVAAELAAMTEIEERQHFATSRLDSFRRSRSRRILKRLRITMLISFLASVSFFIVGQVLSQNAVLIVLWEVFSAIFVIGCCAWFPTRLGRTLYGWRLRLSLKPDSLAAQLSAACDTLARALVDKGMLPEIRKVINDHLRTSHSRRLVYLSAQGLHETSDPRYEVLTPTKQRLVSLLAQRSGGTIGVTGPRGVGKTTLIKSFCPRDSFTNTERGSLLSIAVSAPVQYDAREFLLYLFGTVCRTVLGAEAEQPGPTLPTWARILGLGREHAVVRRWTSRSNVDKPSDDQSAGVQMSTEQAMIRLRVEADDKLKEIEWQQSYSTGWSGSLKLPVGIAAAAATKTSGRQLARRQRAYPQIVDDLRTFISHAAASGRVLIGIDELDKIESAGTAQAFLNDLKVLFGIDRCFFLISVSEDALGEFQRRALGFRNVFDSSFDEIVRVPYLTVADSMQLLERRIIGLPVPFALLCHCLSGGLPRDLIRVARKLVELDTGALGSADVSNVCVALVRQELAANAEAVGIARRGDRLQPEGIRMLLWVNQLAELTGHDVLDHCRVLLAGNGISGGMDNESAETVATRDRIAALTLETLTFAYYCATVVDFFAGGFSDEDLEEISVQAGSGGVVERLARARQALAVHPAVAWDAISSLRGDRQLEQLPYPDLPSAWSLAPVQDKRVGRADRIAT